MTLRTPRRRTPSAAGGIAEWRSRIEALYAGRPAPEFRALAQAVRDFSLRKEDFLAVIDGMAMDAAEDIRAPDWATLDLYCDRVASAVGRLSVRVFGVGEQDGVALAHHLGRALQLTNILRDVDEDAEIGRLYSAARRAAQGRHRQYRSQGRADQRSPRSGLRRSGGARAVPLPTSRHHHGAQSAPHRESAADHGRGLSRHAARHDGARMDSAANAGVGKRAAAVLDRSAVRNHLMARTVHIIGAGLAGLAAAVKLAPSLGAAVVVHEATAYPGGRCRSYFDRSIGMTIDNGNHLVLSGNRSVAGFAEAIGSAARLVGPQHAEFAFVDLASSERWTLRMNDGLPWWIFDKQRRVPGTSLVEYLRLIKLLRVAARCSGRRRHRLFRRRSTTGWCIRCCWRR